MRNDSCEGIFQDMLKKGEKKKITFESSPNYMDPINVLYDNSSYFTTLNNKEKNFNYLTVGLKDRVLYPTGYLIRSYPDFISYLRGWDLFGSLDGNKWTNIHTLSNSSDLENGKVGRYELEGGPFRYFKIVQTEPCLSSNEDNRYKLRLFYLEFFGFSWSGLCTRNRCRQHFSFGYVFVFICLS